MQRLVWFCVGAITLAVVAAASGLIFLQTGANGFSARAQPSAVNGSSRDEPVQWHGLRAQGSAEIQ